MSRIVRQTCGRPSPYLVRCGPPAASGLVERFPYADGDLNDAARWSPWTVNAEVSSGRIVAAGAGVNYCRCNTVVRTPLRLTLETYSVTATHQWQIDLYTNPTWVTSPPGPTPDQHFIVTFKWDAGTGIEVEAANDGGAAWSVTDADGASPPADGSIVTFDVSRDGTARAEYAGASVSIDFSGHTDSAYAMWIMLTIPDQTATVEFDNLIVKRRAY